MDKEQNRNFQIIAAIAVGILIFFITPNLAGAKNIAMLSAFEIDEYAQMPNLIGMLTPGPTFYQTIRNFFVYQHYFYGFPFYFLSALAALPIKLIYGADWLNHVDVLVATLRVTINVLPMVLAAGLLTYIQTRFRNLYASLGLFSFLLLIPGVMVNSVWWHPDGLALLSAVLVLFFLDRDALKLGKSFYIAAAVCGVAVGIKYTGVFFILSIPIYLIWAGSTRKFSILKVLKAAGLFIAIMLAALIVTNPLLLLPQERAAIIETQKLQFQQTGTGILQTTSQAYFATSYPTDFQYHYGELEVLMVALAALLIGVAFSKKRWYYALLLAFLVTMTITINFSATRRTHYFLPVVLPLFSCMSLLFPGKGDPEAEERVHASQVVQFVSVAMLAYQAYLFLPRDQEIYVNTVNKEALSPSINFYHEVTQVLPAGYEDQKRVVYHDWKMYFPPDATFQTEMTWDMPTFDYIASIHPDLILLDRENVALYANPNSVARAVNPGNTQPIHEFYKAADELSLPGYEMFYKDPFGMAFIKTGTK